MTTTTKIAPPRHRKSLAEIARAPSESRGTWRTYLLLVSVLLVSAFPVYWMFVIASSTEEAVSQIPPSVVPGSQLLVNLKEVFTMQDVYFVASLINSFIVSTVVTASVLFFCSLAGFAFAKLRFKGRNGLMIVVILTLTVEGEGGAGGNKTGKAEVGEGKGVGKGRKAARRPVPMPPWPGRLPRPAPALVLPQALPAVVLDADRAPVGVSARLELTGDPAFLLLGTAGSVEITGWAGPWPVDERWWAPAEARRRARFQVCLEDGRALLLSLVSGHWAVEAIYD